MSRFLWELHTHLRVGRMTVFDSVIMRLRTDDGRVGYRENVPLPPGGNAAALAFTHLLRSLSSQSVLGADAFDLEALVARAHATADGNVEAMAGMGLALWDLVGKQRGQPVYRVLGGLYQGPIPVDYTDHIPIGQRCRIAEGGARSTVERAFANQVFGGGSWPRRTLQR